MKTIFEKSFQKIKSFFKITKKQFIINAIIMISLLILLLLTDQLTKHLIWNKYASHYQYNKTIYNNGFVGIRLVKNIGMFYSLGSTIGFVGVQILTSIITLLIFIPCLFSKNNFLTIGLSLIVFGSLGNILDRYLTEDHYVMDWIFTPWIYGGNLGTYNIADIFVCIGSILSAVTIFIYLWKLEKN